MSVETEETKDNEACAERWPVDVDALKKGDVIPIERVAEIVRVTPDSPRFSLLMFALAKKIERLLWDRRKYWTVRCPREGILILRDDQASKFNNDMIERRKRGLFKSHKRLHHVDVNKLSDADLKKHDWYLLRSGMQVASLRAADMQIARIAYRRQHPRLPGTEMKPENNGRAIEGGSA